MHTMKASFPIVSVTTFLQCSLVYTGKYSFPQINNIDNNNNKKRLVCSEMQSDWDTSFIRNWILFYYTGQL